MSGDTLTTLGKFLPTLLTLVIIALCFLRGLLRGFRKSVILLIHYAIGIAVGFVLYNSVRNIFIESDLNWLFSMVGNIGGMDFSKAHSILDAITIALEKMVPMISGAVENPNIQQVIMAFAGLIISLVSGIVCLIIVPIVVRFVLYLVYLLFYREGKFKRNKLAEGEEYYRRSLLGGLVGAVRGMVLSVLTVSFVTSIFFIISGGISASDEKEVEDVDLLEQLGSDIGFDLNALYKGIAQSRSTGVGAIFDKIKIGGKSIDLFYADYFLNSSFTTLPKNEEGLTLTDSLLSEGELVEGELAELYLREEMALIVNLVVEIYQSGVYEEVDGKVVLNEEIMKEHITVLIDEFVHESVLISEITPLTIIGLAESLEQGKVDLGAINELFDAETVATIKSINFPNDISKIFAAAVNAYSLLPLDPHTGSIDVTALSNPETFYTLDVEGVKELFNSLSEITLVTKVLCPVGVGMAVTSMEDKIEAAGIDKTDLDFSNVNWQNEIALIGSIYEKARALELDMTKVLNMEKEEGSKIPVALQYFIDLINDDTTSVTFKAGLLDLTDTIFSSDLYSQVALVFAKSQIAELSFTHADGSPSVLNDSLDLIKTNLTNYEKEHLRIDIHELISSCLDGVGLIPLFMSETEPFEILNGLDVAAARSALLGTYNEDTEQFEGGIYDLRLLSGDLNGDGNIDEGCVLATDSIIETLLMTYASSIISPSIVDSVTEVDDPNDPNYDFEAWPNELNALLSAIEELQTVECLSEIKFELAEGEDITDILPESLTYEDVDVITLAASKSILLSGIIKEKLVSSLEDDPQIGYAVADESIVWMDTIKDEGVIRGELNSLLKAFIVFSDEEKGFDLNDENALINGLGLLLHEATSEDYAIDNNQNILYGLDYEEVIYFAKSQVLMTVLSKEVSNIGASASEDDALKIIIPSVLDTNIDKTNWKNWAYNGESNLDYKKGEFAKLVLVLYYAREYALSLPTPALVAEENNYVLTMDNLLHSVIHMNKDNHVMDSLVLYATTSDALMNQNNNKGSIIYVPQTALVTDAMANNDIEIQSEEIKRLFVVVRDLEVNLIGNDFTKIKLHIVLDKISEDYVREAICISKIFTASAVNKIAETSEIDIPREYQKYNNDNILITNLNASVWYPTSDDKWYESELNKMLVSINELGITADEFDKFNVPSDDQLLASLKNTANDGRSVLDNIYDSKVFRTTISSRILERNDILYRSAALVDEDFKVTNDRTTNVRREEVLKLVQFLDETGISFEGGIDTDLIVASLSNENVRMLVSTSNILNKTVIDKVVVAKDITIPSRFIKGESVDIENEWYPVTEDSWEESEIAMLLATVVELDVKVVDGNMVFPTEPTTLLKALDATSITDPGDEIVKNKAVKVVYRSEVIKATIKTKIEAEEQANNISIRPEAYVNDVTTNYFEYDEIALLAEFANAKDEDGNAVEIELSNIKNKTIFSLLGVKRNREIMSTSNILNKTIVVRFDEVKDITFPSNYLLVEDDPLTNDINEQKVNPNTNLWYPTTNEKWNECELAKLLASVHELELVNYVDPVTDEITMPNTNGLLVHLNADSLTESGTTRLDVVYGSEGLSKTINKKITGVDEIVVRQVAYEKINGAYTDRIDIDEIRQIVEFVNFTNLDIDNHELDAEHLFKLLKDPVKYNDEFTRGQYLRKMVVTSNILNGTTVDKIAGDGVPSADSAIKFADAYLNVDGTVNKDFVAWYPTTSETYDKCELYHMLVSIDELNISALGNQISLSINENIDNLLSEETHNGEEGECILDIVYHSDNIANTISDRLNTSSLPMPNTTYNNKPMYDVTSTRLASDKIFVEDEVEYLLLGLFSLGLEFHDENNSNHTLDYSHMFDNVLLSTLKDNINTVLDSSVMHYFVSDNLINQVQTINNVDYSIVTNTTWVNSSTQKTVVIVNNTCKYIEKQEIIDAIAVLDSLGIEKVDDASGIDLTYLKSSFGSQNPNRVELITQINKSAIMSKIFAQILISNNVLPIIEFTSGKSYTLKPVEEASDGDIIQTLTLADLNEILINNENEFDKLS